jgi:HlyD family secretion protein
VIVALTDPTDNIRPGLSTTAKIKTAEKKQVLSIPMQALAVRTRKDLEEAQKEASKKGVTAVTLAAAKPSEKGADPKKEEIQGVFVVQNGKAVFRSVQTGITGVTDIEVTDGLKDGEEIVTGSYKALRTLKHGAPVKVDNKAPSGGEDKKG